MRPFLLAAALALAVAAPALAPSLARADFDPSGRGGKKKHPPAGPVKPGPANPGAGAGAGKPPRPKRGDDDDPKGLPGPDVFIARFTPIALAQPSQPFPVQRLAQAYRERDGNLKKLIEDFEKRAAAGGAESWAAKVVLAGVSRRVSKIQSKSFRGRPVQAHTRCRISTFCVVSGLPRRKAG